MKNHYDSPEIIVTEGGWAAEAETPEDAVKDHDRVMYYANYTRYAFDVWEVFFNAGG